MRNPKLRARYAAAAAEQRAAIAAAAPPARRRAPHAAHRPRLGRSTSCASSAAPSPAHGATASGHRRGGLPTVRFLVGERLWLLLGRRWRSSPPTCSMQPQRRRVRGALHQRRPAGARSRRSVRDGAATSPRPRSSLRSACSCSGFARPTRAGEGAARAGDRGARDRRVDVDGRPRTSPPPASSPPGKRHGRSPRISPLGSGSDFSRSRAPPPCSCRRPTTVSRCSRASTP